MKEKIDKSIVSHVYGFQKIIKNFFISHKIVIIPLVILILLTFFFNIIVDKHTAFLTGEQVFSFDYIGHLRNILQNFASNKWEWLRINDCIDCPNFYHYSRWYSLINMLIFSIGSLLHIHPFLFYVFLTFSIQLVAIYIFLRLFLKEVQWFAFIVASFIFISLPINFLYLGSGLYSFHHAFLLLFISLTVHVLRNIKEIAVKKMFQLGFATGIIGSVSLNVSIGFLPIFLYSFAIVLIFFYREWIPFWKKIICFITVTLGLMVLINLPMVVSVLLNGNSREYFGFGKLSLLDSFTAGITLVPAYFYTLSPILVLVFFCTVIVLLIKSNFSRNKLVLLTLAYSFVGVLLLGDIVFDFLFHNLPLVNSMRSLHRLIVFEELILSFIIYSGLSALWGSQKKNQKILAILFSLILVYTVSIFIKNNWGYLNEISIPNEYFQVNMYLSKNSDKKVYFPTYLPWGQGINDNYNWSKTNNPHVTLYQNPFTSIFALSNLVMFERYPMVPQKQMEMRALFDYENNPDNIVWEMKNLGIKYVVLDKNFLWQKNFPNFNYNKIVDQFSLIKSFGNINVYQIKLEPEKCKKAYGEFAYGYCHIEQGERPEYLLNVGKEDYLIGAYEPKGNEYMSLLGNENIYPFIADPILQKYLANRKVNFFGTMTVNSQRGMLNKWLFQKEMNKGDYKIIIPLLKLNKAQLLFGKSVLDIYIDGAKITSLIPYSLRDGITYESIPLHLQKRSFIRLNVSGIGSLVMKNPYILEQDKYNFLIKNEEWQPNIIRGKL